jgi:predicted aspartyl protease
MANASTMERLKAKQVDVATAAEELTERPEEIAQLIAGLQAEKSSAKYAYEKTLRRVSERRPELIYPHFDAFAALLDHENNFLKWGAIMTVANLTAVDAEGRFEAIFDRYYAPIPGPSMITAANIIGSSPRIAQAKPHLAERITQEILKVEQAEYEHHGSPSPECRNVALGHALDAFDQFFDLIEDKAAILTFAKRQLRNTRKQVAKKAERFLRVHVEITQQERARVGRILVHVSIRNLLESDRVLTCDALVDTGSAHMVLPRAWKDRLGNLATVRHIECETATQQVVDAEVCGPVEIRLEGFKPIYGEVLFLDMEPEDGVYEPLVGYIVLEQAQAAVDMLGHRLIHVKKSDLKKSA